VQGAYQGNCSWPSRGWRWRTRATTGYCRPATWVNSGFAPIDAEPGRHGGLLKALTRLERHVQNCVPNPPVGSARKVGRLCGRKGLLRHGHRPAARHRTVTFVPYSGGSRLEYAFVYNTVRIIAARFWYV
jgi:hypothetical protein